MGKEMHILFISYDQSEYAHRLLEAIKETDSALTVTHCATPSIAENTARRPRHYDALIIELRSLMSNSGAFPENDQKNFADKYSIEGVPVIVLHEPGQYGEADNIIYEAPLDLAFQKGSLVPPVGHFVEKIIPSIQRNINCWNDERPRNDADILALGYRKPVRTNTSGNPGAKILDFAPMPGRRI